MFLAVALPGLAGSRPAGRHIRGACRGPGGHTNRPTICCEPSTRKSLRVKIEQASALIEQARIQVPADELLPVLGLCYELVKNPQRGDQISFTLSSTEPRELAGDAPHGTVSARAWGR